MIEQAKFSVSSLTPYDYGLRVQMFMISAQKPSKTRLSLHILLTLFLCISNALVSGCWRPTKYLAGLVLSTTKNTPTRIAQVAPLAESVPPKLYGGTERVFSWLTEDLVEQGHDVTLFASADSETSAELVRAVPQGLRLAGIRDHTASLLVMLEEVRRRASSFDVIHFHVDLLQFPSFRDSSTRCLTTLHGRLDLPDFHPVYRAFPEMPLVSITRTCAKK